jgi:SNF2 family DNA or RNA helicase
MEYKPYKYQTYAIEFIEAKDEAAIFLSMGLGKTVITLTAIKDLLDAGKVNKVLIVAPKRVAESTWPDEIKKWDHLSGLDYAVATGAPKQRMDALNENNPVTLINRENIEWIVEKSGYEFNFDMVVLDELSSFKSYQSKRFKAMIKVRSKIDKIVGLTGTPSSNGLMDLWAEFRILDFGERLGRYITNYRQRYFEPDKRNQTVIFSYKPLPFAEETIYDKISDITISMKAEDYLELPDLIINEVKVDLSESERATYDGLCKDMVVQVQENEIDAINAAALSNKLLQMANGAVYDETKTPVFIHDRKLDALEDLVEGANGKPVLIAYWFKHDLERIKKRFDVREIKTTDDIVDWNNGKIQIGVIHPASAGHGLNLQSGGSTLIWFGLTWSLELYDQTNARLYRQGQKESVVIHHIITKGTIDEDVMAALKDKQETQDALINAVKARIGG